MLIFQAAVDFIKIIAVWMIDLLAAVAGNCLKLDRVCFFL